jgi:hypothetical protein
VLIPAESCQSTLAKHRDSGNTGQFFFAVDLAGTSAAGGMMTDVVVYQGFILLAANFFKTV